MSGRDDLAAFVDRCGGAPQAAKRLGIPYPTLASVLNGSRGVGKNLAARIESGSKGKLKASKLIWIRAEQARVA